MNQSDIYHIIVAAGKGSRFGTDTPKQFCLMGGRPVLMETIDRIRDASPDSDIILVLSENFIDYWSELCAQYGFQSPTVVTGGETRWQSVKNAISAIPETARVITVHDGARPLLTRRIVNDVVKSVQSGHSGALPAINVTDSLRLLTDGTGLSTAVERSAFRAVQTPQAFDAATLRRAYAMPFDPKFTDDASVVEGYGCSDIELVEGDTTNIKITHPLDIKIAELYMRAR